MQSLANDGWGADFIWDQRAVSSSDQNGLNPNGATTTSMDVDPDGAATRTTVTVSAGDAGPEPDPGNFTLEGGNSPCEVEILQNGCPTAGLALPGSMPPLALRAAGQTRSTSAKGRLMPRPVFRGTRRGPG
ncbi:hypothetical protein K438DRAFT_1952892 [Mycena galopus ATCC 62051]|nr:hypothetical protein K438DRAFT_1952892 [Mycena galopus ATCC 62051]